MRSIPTAILALSFAIFFTGPVTAQVSLSPFLGYQIPNEDTLVYVEGELSYVTAGSSALGLDVVAGRLPFDLRIIATYVNIGNVAEESNRELDTSGSHWGIGVQRRLPIGLGAIELAASYLYISESFTVSPNGAQNMEFDRGEGGFLGGIRFVAPYSDTIDLAVLAKLEFASSYAGSAVNEYNETVELSRSGTTYVFAVGINWHIGGEK